jgi:redox-sensitive bicupin YhaK (pirin superfamily)
MTAIDKYEIEVLPPEKQGSGEFDNGKITEIKPIDFPHGTGSGKRVGPLFYWAWASANGDGIIGMHPHQAFEIISYVLKGEIGHTDSLGNKTRVGEGGAQIMQTGSGVYHQEEMYGERTEFFQIWFEPNLNETIKTKPTYRQLTDEEFPVDEFDGGNVKKILGEGSPMELVADSKMEEIQIDPGKSYLLNQGSDRLKAIVVIAGKGKLSLDNEKHDILKEYYITIKSGEPISTEISNTGNEKLILAIVEVPLNVNYKLYGEE